jgi:hypothetical protein
VNQTLLARSLKLAFPMEEAADAGAGAAAGGGAVDAGADKGAPELTLRDELSAAVEIDEKGPEASDLSAAARRLASARKGGGQTKAPIDKVDDKTIQDSERVGQANAEKAKRDAELAKLPPEERAKAEADDKRKADEAAAGAKLEAPTHWPAPARELFAKQPPEVRSFLLERHKAMEADYTKKMQELAPVRRLNDVLDEGFKPYDDEMRKLGVTRDQALRELLGAHHRWKSDPQEYIRWVAGVSGIDLKNLVEGAAAADPAGESPTVKALRAEIDGLKAQVGQFSGAHAQQQQNAQLSEVTKFAEEKDAQGNLKRPYFDEVAKEMTALLKNGVATDLQDAYDRAIHANPTTRARVLAASQAEQRAKDEADRKAKAEAARKASAANVTGEGAAADMAAQTGSVREDLEAAFAGAGDRV